LTQFSARFRLAIKVPTIKDPEAGAISEALWKNPGDDRGLSQSLAPRVHRELEQVSTLATNHGVDTRAVQLQRIDRV
jgi:hypothetical protein